MRISASLICTLWSDLHLLFARAVEMPMPDSSTADAPMIIEHRSPEGKVVKWIVHDAKNPPQLKAPPANIREIPVTVHLKAPPADPPPDREMPPWLASPPNSWKGSGAVRGGSRTEPSAAHSNNSSACGAGSLRAGRGTAMDDG